jgi:hypothetical protein
MDASTFSRIGGTFCVKLDFFKRSREERSVFIREAAARRGVPAAMLEKDFWVSWTLGVLYSHPEFAEQLVFKGGTSLSKVFGVIDRFSEDIDLSVSPAFLGIDEQSVEQADSRNQRTGWMKELEVACTESVRTKFLPELNRIAVQCLAEPESGVPWMEFQVDGATHSPVVLFHYPSTEPGFLYLHRFVKIEFGSLTDQRPAGKHLVRPWLADEFPTALEDFKCELVALEVERTYWEKATILHSEFHRDRSKPLRDHLSRHYYDMAALTRSPLARPALNRHDLRERVVDWKSRFFAAGWARYDLAKPGTFRLKPPEFRVAELEQDYRAMREMFPTAPPPFETIVKTLSELEQEINTVQPA